MAYPVRPPIPNPYQIVGQAAQQLGGQVQQFGRERDELSERFRLMMEKRADAQIKAQQQEEEFALKKNADERAAAEADAKAKRESDRAKFFSRTPGADGASPYNPVELQNAMATGLIDANEYRALKPERVERKVQNIPGKGLYEIPDAGAPVQLVEAAPEAPAKPRVQQVTLDDGTLGVLDLDTQKVTPVRDAEGNPIKGGTKDQGGKIFAQENTLRDEFNKKTEPFEKALTAYDKMYRAIESNNSADAYAAVIDFVKTLDPGSTVREGEYMTAKSAGAGGSYGKLKQSIRNLYDGKMTPEVRKNLLDAGRNLMAAEKASYDRIRQDYKGRVEGYNQRGVNLDTTAVLSTYPQVEGIVNPPKSSKANDKTFRSFQEAASLPPGTGFWINGKHYTKGQN